jgi:hypothetical protein
MTRQAMMGRRTAHSEWTSKQGSARALVLLIVFLALGAGLGLLILRRPAQPVTQPERVELSEPSLTVLAHLEQPVEMRFYSLLDPQSDARLRALSGHVSKLLAAYSQESSGKVMVLVQTNVNPNVALAEGIKGFDLDKGEGSYLGISVSCAGNKEVLAQLSPEWEPALEADISRAIAKVGVKDSRSTPAAKPAVEDAALIEQIQQEIPNLATMSTEDAIRAVRAKSVEEFTQAISKMNELVKEATEQLAKAQHEGSAADQQEAFKALQAAQAAETQVLKQIAADSQQRVEALKRVKGRGSVK